jgi:hypothetical protein
MYSSLRLPFVNPAVSQRGPQQVKRTPQNQFGANTETLSYPLTEQNEGMLNEIRDYLNLTHQPLQDILNQAVLGFYSLVRFNQLQHEELPPIDLDRSDTVTTANGDVLFKRRTAILHDGTRLFPYSQHPEGMELKDIIANYPDSWKAYLNGRLADFGNADRVNLNSIASYDSKELYEECRDIPKLFILQNQIPHILARYVDNFNDDFYRQAGPVAFHEVSGALEKLRQDFVTWYSERTTTGN